MLLRNAAILMQPPAQECCADSLRVRQRLAASCTARAAWYTAWELITALRLEAVEQGHPYPPLILPHLEVVSLPGGLPVEPEPSIDRCSACQTLLDEVRLAGSRQRRGEPDPGSQPPGCLACAVAGVRLSLRGSLRY